jgi:hypothetical protein
MAAQGGHLCLWMTFLATRLVRSAWVVNLDGWLGIQCTRKRSTKNNSACKTNILFKHGKPATATAEHTAAAAANHAQIE